MRLTQRYLTKEGRRVAKVRSPFDGPMPSPSVPLHPKVVLERSMQLDDREKLRHLVQAVDEAKESLAHLQRLNDMYDGRLRAGSARQAKQFRVIHEERSDDDVAQWARKQLVDAGPTFYMKETSK
ncbi:Hypothetical protein, putative [Bodo saltans]|uniref:Uncharacterized protein n=1 Tax=Bodo saltans TaxID=75058 RepID=A0A0S4JPT7_BODSA|nr:Hypothetical protein, putative [Bodo saltans]|eukprot:CUG92259.1 Hypothetical protein, putative [Bodo saltans]